MSGVEGYWEWSGVEWKGLKCKTVEGGEKKEVNWNGVEGEWDRMGV